MALNYSFSGKRVLVTGGGRGIGYDITKRLYNDGAVLFVIDKDQNLLTNLNKEMPNITTLCVDLLNWDETRKAVLSIAPLDHLVNNAGVIKTEPLLDVTPEHIDLMFGVNVKASINVSQSFVKGIIEKQAAGGTIVNISSLSDRVGFGNAAIYATTKAAVTRLTMAMALEFAEYNVRVNCVCPSFVITDMITELPPSMLEACQPLMARVLIKEQMETKDITDSVVFLLSPLSSKVNGTSLALDGGLRAN